MSNELPEPWATELSPKGIHSYRDFARATGIAAETARRLCTSGATSSATIGKVADALFNRDATKVWDLYGLPLKDYGPWELPPEARLLTEEQRAAVSAVVMAMVPPKARRGGGSNAEASNGGEPDQGSTTRSDYELIAHDEEHAIEEEQIDENP